jgi:hypothetical protein
MGSAASEWIEVDAAQRKRLAFDHAEILAAAVDRLRSKVEYTSLPAFLLEEPFTLPQLQRTYEIVLGRPMDKSAFRKRMNVDRLNPEELRTSMRLALGADRQLQPVTRHADVGSGSRFH